jgi:hypothetical protein
LIVASPDALSRLQSNNFKNICFLFSVLQQLVHAPGIGLISRIFTVKPYYFFLETCQIFASIIRNTFIKLVSLASVLLLVRLRAVCDWDRARTAQSVVMGYALDGRRLISRRGNRRFCIP